MKKCNVDRSHYLFDNQALVSLIVPLIIEQLFNSAGWNGRFHYGRKCLVKQMVSEFRW